MLPEFLWVTTADVAKAAVDGMAAGKSVGVPGAPNRAAAALYRFAPRELLLSRLARNHPGVKP